MINYWNFCVISKIANKIIFIFNIGMATFFKIIIFIGHVYQYVNEYSTYPVV